MLEIHSDITDYIDKYWKPNQDDSYIVVEKESDIYDNLLDWFKNHKEFTIDVGPFIKISPYGDFPVEDNPNRVEFLFIYDEIDKTKLQAHHLTLT